MAQHEAMEVGVKQLIDSAFNIMALFKTIPRSEETDVLLLEFKGLRDGIMEEIERKLYYRVVKEDYSNDIEVTCDIYNAVKKMKDIESRLEVLNKSGNIE